MANVELENGLSGMIDKNGTNYVHLNKENFDLAKDFLKKNELWGVMLINDSQSAIENLTFLENLETLKHLIIHCNVEDTEALGNFMSLETLEVTLTANAVVRDVSLLDNLRTLTCVFDNKLRLPSNLRNLYLRKANCSPDFLFENQKLKGLSSLTLVQSNIKGLSGINNFKDLEHLSLAYMPKLTEFGDIRFLDKLTYLEFDVCKSVNYDLELANLTTLKLNKIGKLRSLDFITASPDLKMMTILDTPLESGDLEPAMNHPSLEYLGFSGRKYNFTFSELNNALAVRHGKPQRC